MPDSSEIQPLPSPAANPNAWLTEYFHARARLATAESDFHCDPACTRPGCNNPSILVPVSLIDLMGAARHHQEPVSAHFREHYALGLIPREPNDWIRKVSPRLHKPCPFLHRDLCGVYPVRPLACILFPEYLVLGGRFQAEAGKELFRDFLCLKSPLRLSPERAAIMRRLQTMWEREALMSSYYLFGAGGCYIDFGNLTQELLEFGGTAQTTGAPAAVSNLVMERFFQTRLSGFRPFDEFSLRLQHLDSPEGQARFLHLLQDDRLLKKLTRQSDGPDQVFRFAKGKLKRSRRSLLPGEYNFY